MNGRLCLYGLLHAACQQLTCERSSHHALLKDVSIMHSSHCGKAKLR